MGRIIALHCTGEKESKANSLRSISSVGRRNIVSGCPRLPCWCFGHLSVFIHEVPKITFPSHQDRKPSETNQSPSLLKMLIPSVHRVS